MLNGHFRPQWSLCPFCLIEFDVLGKIEDFEEDSAYIMDALGVRVREKYLEIQTDMSFWAWCVTVPPT